MGMEIDSHTPNLTLVDGRRLVVRKVAFHRAPGSDDTREDVIGITLDLAGRITQLCDARFWTKANDEPQPLPNRTHLYSLSGIPLLSESVDAGWDLALVRESGVVDRSWDSKEASWYNDYDELLRPITTYETAPAKPSRIVSRYLYADGATDWTAQNQCGQPVELYDNAGVLNYLEFGLLGQCLIESRQFLKEPQLPDWTLSPELDEPHFTRFTFGPLGDLLTQTDASGNQQRFTHDIAGATRGIYLKPQDEAETLLLSEVKYNALGQIESETTGNGVVNTSCYDPTTERLGSIRAAKDDVLLQQLEYRYDPVGNVTEISDSAQAVHFFRNQEIAPTHLYRYDSLYQLVEATGRESVDSTDNHRPPEDAAPNPGDTSRLLPYRESYLYDQGGNMLELRHVRDGNNYTRCFAVDKASNRSLLKTEELPTPEFNTSFDAAGNLLFLQPGSTLQWGSRNQLYKITTVTRVDEDNDEEVYIYDGGDQRVRKLRTSKTQGTLRRDEVYYLPGLEIRTRGTAQKTDEHLEVITVQAGRTSVRWLHWVSGKPVGIADKQFRYALHDVLGSCTLELDACADLISHEGYLPFGGTSWWTAQSALEASYKTIRYSGKERDASGLYYYGYRYYAPWLQRWINPDPWGEIDGLNMYCMVSNNPGTQADQDGRSNRQLGFSVEWSSPFKIETPDQKAKRKAQAAATWAANVRKTATINKVLIHLEVLDLLGEQLRHVERQLSRIESGGGLSNAIASRVAGAGLSKTFEYAGSTVFGALGGAVGGATGGSMSVPLAAGGAYIGKKIGASAAREFRAYLDLDTSLAMDAGKLNSEKLLRTARRSVLGPVRYELAKQLEEFDLRDHKVRADLKVKTAMEVVKKLPGGEVAAIIIPEALKIREERTKMATAPENLMRLVISLGANNSRLEESLVDLKERMGERAIALPPLYLSSARYADIFNQTNEIIKRIDHLAVTADRLHKRNSVVSR
jgi:insecticidal toxin complex protein TccC